MSVDSQSESNQDFTPAGLPSSPEKSRNWLPLVLALAMVLAIVVAGSLLRGRSRPAPIVTPVNAPADAYAPQLTLSNIQMSESSNLAGSKVTYIDGKISNLGNQTVTGVTVQVLFRNAANEVAQNETVPLTLVRMREPYIDTAPVSVMPLKPASSHDFRLIFDTLAPDWAGTTPEIRVLKVQSK